MVAQHIVHVCSYNPLPRAAGKIQYEAGKAKAE